MNASSTKRSRPPVFSGQAVADPLQDLSIRGTLVLGVSWMLVMALGLWPVVEAVRAQQPSFALPTALAFSIAVGSAALLRKHYSWVGGLLHIVGQILIWLSIFCLSLAAALPSFS